MSRYILIRRLRGPAFLLLVGINALLAQAHILGWSESWPFYLILAGVISLAVRYLGLHYLLAKCLAAGFTCTCNFIARRQLLFVRHIPA